MPPLDAFGIGMDAIIYSDICYTFAFMPTSSGGACHTCLCACDHHRQAHFLPSRVYSARHTNRHTALCPSVTQVGEVALPVPDNSQNCKTPKQPTYGTAVNMQMSYWCGTEENEQVIHRFDSIVK